MSADRVAQEARIIRLITVRLVPFLILLYTVAYVDRSTLGFAKLQMSADVGISDTAYGLGAGLFFLGYFLFEVPSNLILSRVGARRWIARILLTWGAITIAMALINSAMMFYVLRFLLGAAEAGFYPGVVYYFTRWFPQRYLARVFGLFLLAQPFALIITGPLSASLLGFDGVGGLRGWQWLFIMSGLPAILLVWPTLRILTDSPATATWLDPADRAWLESELSADRERDGVVEHPNPLRALGDKRVLALALTFLPFPLAIYGMTLWLPTILAGFGTSMMTNGFLFALPYCFAVLALRIIPRSSDRTGERYLHIGGCAALAGIGLASSALATSNTLQLAALCLAAFGLYSGQTVLWTLPPRFLTGTAAAAGVALINAIGNLGGYIGPFAVGAIKDRTGQISSGLYFLAGSLLITVVMVFILRRMLEHGRAPVRAGPIRSEPGQSPGNLIE
jgi:MFS family permease